MLAGEAVLGSLVMRHGKLGLSDRCEIAVGKRADLVRVSVVDGVPIVRTVRSEGRRVI